MNENTLCPGYEPIDGYVLRQRLGAGGYGEVWKCDAPGGLQKAIKFIFGASNGTQAERELKSLHRVAKVYHPFLLSIERIETVNQQTLIITELAESSLEDRLQHYITAGSTGIPRTELLQYFRDAADALDFLASDHSLQHLDVKPGNLLIVAKRIKVADFGLLKDLNEAQISSVAGMTPAYSAPEVFDGRPAARSDQYSLAIAYVELLTGKLPFPGQTMAELAQQHLSSTPNLDALPPADREVVARALLKDPYDRFTNCRQFIDQLIKVKHNRLQHPVAAHDTQVPRARTTNPLTAVTGATEPTYRDSREQSSSDVEQGRINRCLFIGLGGAGCDSVATLKYRAAPMVTNPDSELDARWLTIDTQKIASEENIDVDAHPGATLEPDEKLEIRLQSTDVYRNVPAGRFNALSRRWVYNIPRSRTTEGIRPLGLLAFIHAKSEIRQQLEAKLKPIIQSDDFDNARSAVYLISSLHGGTGSGILAEMGLLVREVIDSLATDAYADRSPQIHAVVTAGEVTQNGPARMGPAAAVATLSELSYYMSLHRNVPPLDARSANGRYQRARPFDSVFLLHGGQLGDTTAFKRAVENSSSVVLAHACSAASNLLSSADDRYPDDHWLKTLRLTPITVDDNMPEEQFALFAAAQSIGGLLRSIDSSAKQMDDSKFAQFSRSQIELFTTDEKAESRDDEVASAWLARSSTDEAVRTRQLELDKESWTAGIRSLLVQHRLSWKEAEQLDRAAIAAIKQFHLGEDGACAKGVAKLLNCSSADPRVNASVGYLESFLKTAVLRNSEFAVRGEGFSQELRAALKAISGAMPSELGRQLATQISHSRSSRSLLSAIASSAMKSLTRLLPIDAPSAALDPQAFVTEVRALAAELSVEQGVKLIRSKSDAAAVAEEIAEGITKRAPQLSSNGGDISRVVVAPAQKLTELKRILPLATVGEEVMQKTTFVEASDSSDEPFVLCEGANLAIPLLVQRQWRPSGDVFTLAEKLHTRVDVEWPAIHDLLGIPDSPTISAPPQLPEAGEPEHNPFAEPPATGDAQRVSPFTISPGAATESEVADSPRTQHI